MRDRLIELIKRDNCRNPFNCSSKCEYVASDDCHSERLADLILADGWIRPPCKVGDVVYWYNMGGRLTEAVVIDTLKAKTKHGFEYDIRFSDFGKTVFLTREEAERALKGDEEK
jgi:hypothetical protein